MPAHLYTSSSVEQWTCCAGCILLRAVLTTAARHVESEGVQGSCTACLLTINKDTGRMQAATLGDSGFLIVGPRAPHQGDLEVRLLMNRQRCWVLIAQMGV